MSCHFHNARDKHKEGGTDKHKNYVCIPSDAELRKMGPPKY